MSEEERLFLEQLRRMRLAIPSQQTWRILQQVDHKKFKDALESHWQLKGGIATPQSICWLFCWAKTGINSARTADHCRDVFNQIFARGSYSRLDSERFHEFARQFRYQTQRPIQL